ncbi:2631_t:CDS:2 [Ambispora gerdemannii]|uniref:2631_t:CDS:1 n=1 Tax=Ambispora gerdemannii TaxID=144530 RepID=A0A9N8VWK7_9GLOM|nr:2631_t:CDS:2 [Ambispora gerdemannii]
MIPTFNIGSGEGLTASLQLQNTTRFSTEDIYVFDITANSSVFIVSGSNHEIKLYDRNSLRVDCVLSFHWDTITKVKAHKENFLLSSSKDASVALWDLRSPGGPVQVFRASRTEPLLAFDFNSSETILAAATELVHNDAKIIFWDTRQNNSIAGQFAESHNDDITQLHFHPSIPSKMLSGSTDGLICNYDITNFDEDEALVGVINSGSSVHKAGYFGPQADYVYCLTHIETFSIWSEKETSLLCNFGDLRQLSALNNNTVLDYAIDCYYDQPNQRLFVLGGSNSGDISIIHVSVNQLDICQNLRGGHTEVVRGVFWDPRANLMLSGGEDSNLSYWSAPINNCRRR